MVPSVAMLAQVASVWFETWKPAACEAMAGHAAAAAKAPPPTLTREQAHEQAYRGRGARMAACPPTDQARPPTG